MALVPSTPTPIRYMGTKRALAPHVRDALGRVRRAGYVADLFSGMGAVAVALAPDVPVLANDAMSFASCVARARLLQGAARPPAALLPALGRDYIAHRQRLTRLFAREIAAENQALASRDPASVRRLMEKGDSSTNSRAWLKQVSTAREATSPDGYQLASLYFGSSYFGMSQATDIDAVRYAIDSAGGQRDDLLACWLVACSRIVNAPGHTAQYLRPKDEATFARLARRWSRSFWAVFHEVASDWRRVGTARWRSRNAVATDDALSLVASDELASAGAVYADPPYTKDQYSRFYHVYETLYLYDYPSAAGAGRCRATDDRHASAFCLASKVEWAFETLFDRVARHGLPLVLSYPAEGLLHRTATDLLELIRTHFGRVTVLSYAHDHSTMGASKGRARQSATENVYVCQPA